MEAGSQLGGEREEEGWQEGLRGWAGLFQSLLEGAGDLYPGSSAPDPRRSPWASRAPRL